MNRSAFLLGFVATGGQTLLLRELVSSLGGSELFIGSALFGWLAAVAAGAWAGGRWPGRLRAALLLVLASLVLPLCVAAARLAPLAYGVAVGEAIPLVPALTISFLVMAPLGVLSGWLFPAVAGEHGAPADGIVRVYLFEGIGAFAAGLAVVLAAGTVLSTPAVALALVVIVMAAALGGGASMRTVRGAGAVLAAVSLLAAVAALDHPLNRALEAAKYAGYAVAASFDTPYSHQALLLRDGAWVLLTDNAVEATRPDAAAAESHLLPVLAYRPGAREVLFIGRTEFGVSALARQLPDLTVTSVDPRARLTAALAEHGLAGEGDPPVHELPRRFIAGGTGRGEFDAIVLDPGDPSTYRAAGLLTPQFLGQLRRVLNDSGVVLLATAYDTDRFVGRREAELLATLRASFAQVFAHVILWPGEQTLLLASDAAVFDVPLDTVFARLDSLPCRPLWVNSSYLFDRLSSLRTERLEAALAGQGAPTTIDRPALTLEHIGFRAERHPVDAAIVGLTGSPAWWAVGVPAALVGLIVWGAAGRRAGRRYGLVLYFVAGAVSLAAEQLAFYVYQSRAGSLYSEIALLIGAFMLGLAVGTWYAARQPQQRGLIWPSLSTLALALAIYLTLTGRIDPSAFLLYHMLFLFVAAAATGSLFVAATRRCYPSAAEANRGLGYACELAGSSLGALLVPTVLLPLLGVPAILIGLIGLVGLAGVGAAIVDRRT